MSESAEALFGERAPHFRGASVERELEIPTRETLLHANGQPTGTHVVRLPHQEPSVTFVSSGMKGPKEKNILSSAGHGLLRFTALPTGVLLFAGGMAIDTAILSGMVATGVVALSIPMLALLALGTGAVVGGVKLLEFAAGKK